MSPEERSLNDSTFSEIRTFTTVAEIESIPGFLPNNPVDKTNYKEILGDSDLDEEILCCLRKDNGNLCAEGHAHGWVVRLFDGTVTVIGRDCAKDKFELDAKLSKDSRIFNTQKLRKNKLSRLFDYLADREVAETSLSRIQDKVLEIKNRLESFEREIGSKNLSRLRDMARGGSGVVSITAITIVPYIDDEGERAEERRAVGKRLGSLRGIELFRPENVDTILSGVRDVHLAYRHAAAQAVVEKPKADEIERLVAIFARSEQLPKELERLRALDFAFHASDFTLLCYLSDDRVERYRAAGIAMRSLGITGGRERAKIWLASIDARYKVEFGAQQLRIGV